MVNFDRLENITTLIVNSHKVEIPGLGNANQGRLTSKFKHDFEFAVEILAPMMIVGYPTYSEYRGSARDLFKPSTLQGGYKYQRAYRFSNGARFTSFHNILFDAARQRLNGTFSTTNFPEDKFTRDWHVCDLLETFIPHAPGIIKSVMAVEWRDASELLHAIIESEYYFNHNESLPGLHWRHVKFATNHKGSEYTQSEKITVIDQLDFGVPTNQFEASALGGSAQQRHKVPAL